MSAVHAATVGIVLVAVVWDLSTRRIPNLLTLGAAAAGLIVQAYIGGWGGAGTSVAGWVVGVALFLPIFALGGMGAGDVKLLGAIGAWLGPAAAMWVALYSAIAAGLMGIVVALGSGYMTQALVNISWILTFWRRSGLRPVPALTLATHKGPRLAYAVSLFAGLMVTLWLR